MVLDLLPLLECKLRTNLSSTEVTTGSTDTPSLDEYGFNSPITTIKSVKPPNNPNARD